MGALPWRAGVASLWRLQLRLILIYSRAMNSHAKLVLPLALALAAPVAAQDPFIRAKQQVDTTSLGIGLQPSVGSDGDFSAVTFFDGGSSGTRDVSAVFSDGRGTAWSAPVRVDDDITDANKLMQFDSCFVSDGVTYVLWRDERNGSSSDDLYFSRSVAGGPFAANTQIDVGPATGAGGRVNAYRMSVSPDPAGDHIYILAQIDTPGDANDTLYLTASHDGGLTFGSGVEVPQGLGTYSVESLAVKGDGMTVHVAWADDRNDPGAGGSGTLDDVFYQRSTDGGATFLVDDVQIDSGPGAGDSAATGTTGFRIDSVGSRVAVAWMEELTDTSNEEVRLAVSEDGGTTWNADVLVGGYDPAIDDVDTMDMRMAGNGNICVAYNDNRTSGGTLDAVYVSTTTDGGVTFSEVEVSGPAGGNDPRFAGQGAFLGLAFADDTNPSNAAKAADSEDFGVTWRTDVTLADNTNDADLVVAGYNALYKNWIHAWLSNDVGTNNVFVGGYRAQTLDLAVTPDGLGNVDFDWSLSDFPAGDNFGLVLLSNSPGMFTIDGRNTGLTPDSAFLFSVNSGNFLVPLVGGSGALPTVTTNAVGSGAVFYTAALSFNLSGGTVTIGEFSDTQEITVP